MMKNKIKFNDILKRTSKNSWKLIPVLLCRIIIIFHIGFLEKNIHMFFNRKLRTDKSQQPNTYFYFVQKSSTLICFSTELFCWTEGMFIHGKSFALIFLKFPKKFSLSQTRYFPLTNFPLEISKDQRFLNKSHVIRKKENLCQ